MTPETFAAFVIDEALDELPPDTLELWQSWLGERPDRWGERDEILASLAAARRGVEDDPAFLHPSPSPAAAGSAPEHPARGARALPFPSAGEARSRSGTPWLKQAAALALLLVATGAGYFAGSRVAPDAGSLAEASPVAVAADPETASAAPALAGAWARYHWSLESAESSVSLRQAPGNDPL